MKYKKKSLFSTAEWLLFKYNKKKAFHFCQGIAVYSEFILKGCVIWPVHKATITILAFRYSLSSDNRLLLIIHVRQLRLYTILSHLPTQNLTHYYIRLSLSPCFKYLPRIYRIKIINNFSWNHIQKKFYSILFFLF